MRGKPNVIFLSNVLLRITPADAGKTTLDMTAKRWYKDHPRGCGENILDWTDEDVWEGSPPRMRGKHCEAAGYRDDRRITPADAGKTYKRNPRVRGG